MRIAIVGTGYQGLVVGTCFAENGHRVTCVDRDADRIEILRQGRSPIHEPGLEELIARNIEEERLTFTTDLPGAVAECLMIFLCVGTPEMSGAGADLSNVFAAVEQIAAAMDGYRIIVNKSTCPPGTAADIERILKSRTKHAFDVVVNPDFIREGAAVDDFLRPDRIVAGCGDVRVREILKELFGPFLRTGRPFLAMSPRAAEMTKYATNIMLAARISLMNQIADLCAAYDVDVAEVREGLAYDDRIGSTYLFPGLGFGGSGLPTDLATFTRLARDRGVECDLVAAILAVNERRVRTFLQHILDYYGGDIATRRIGIWGASFKPRTDDLRGAPALAIIDGLTAAGAQVVVYDPVAAAKLRARYGDAVQIASKYYEALRGAHGLVIATEWNEFRRPDFERMAQLMAGRVIFDGRNLYTPAVMKDHGFTYFSIGRPASTV